MPEVVGHKDDDTDIESFEREEKRMEEEAAKVGKINVNSDIWAHEFSVYAACGQGTGK